MTVGSRIGAKGGFGLSPGKLLSKTVSYPKVRGSPARKFPLGRHIGNTPGGFDGFPFLPSLQFPGRYGHSNAGFGYYVGNHGLTRCARVDLFLFHTCFPGFPFLPSLQFPGRYGHSNAGYSYYVANQTAAWHDCARRFGSHTCALRFEANGPDQVFYIYMYICYIS